MVLLDSNVILDLWDRDTTWSAWSSSQLRALSPEHELVINVVVYAEISARFSTRAKVDEKLEDLSIRMDDIPKDSAFLACKAFIDYRSQGGQRTKILPDFFIGAHAAVLGCALLTRAPRHYSAYFPTIRLIAP